MIVLRTNFLSRMGVPLLRRLATQVWYRDSSEENLHEPHHTDPPQYLTPQQLTDKSGVRMLKMEKCEDEAEIAKFRKEGGYKYFDHLEISREALPDLEQSLKKYYTEHMHTDEEVRLVQKGTGFFEVRDCQDKWIRLQVGRGDLVHLPAGMYHRLTLDQAKYIKMARMFTEEPNWKAINRPDGDNHPVRKAYLRSLQSSKK